MRGAKQQNDRVFRIAVAAYPLLTFFLSSLPEGGHGGISWRHRVARTAISSS